MGNWTLRVTLILPNMNIKRFWFGCFLWGLGLTACATAQGQTPEVCFSQKCFTVEVMRTDQELKRGMQGRMELDPDHGMLFVFTEDRPHRFWMKNTFVALDMIWLDRDHRVVGMQHAAPPCLNDPCPSYMPSKDARYVLELRAGVGKKWNIMPGDRAQFKLNKRIE